MRERERGGGGVIERDGKEKKREGGGENAEREEGEG